MNLDHTVCKMERIDRQRMLKHGYVIENKLFKSKKH